jgi:quercetin dioxygenase-like cupin family protein
MKRILCSLLVATLPFGGVLAQAPKEKNAKVTLVFQHELPNVPGKSMKGVLVEYGPGGYSPGHTHPQPLSSTRPCSRGRSAARSTTDR